MADYAKCQLCPHEPRRAHNRVGVMCVHDAIQSCVMFDVCNTCCVHLMRSTSPPQPVSTDMHLVYCDPDEALDTMRREMLEWVTDTVGDLGASPVTWQTSLWLCDHGHDEYSGSYEVDTNQEDCDNCVDRARCVLRFPSSVCDATNVFAYWRTTKVSYCYEHGLEAFRNPRSWLAADVLGESATSAEAAKVLATWTPN